MSSHLETQGEGLGGARGRMASDAEDRLHQRRGSSVKTPGTPPYPGVEGKVSFHSHSESRESKPALPGGPIAAPLIASPSGRHKWAVNSLWLSTNMNSPLGIEARLLGTPPRSPGGLGEPAHPASGRSALCCFCSQLHSQASPFTHLKSDPNKILIKSAHTHCWQQGHRNGAVKAGLWCWPCLLLCHDGPATKAPWVVFPQM